MYRNEAGLFYALEVVLRAAKEPLTCVQIYDENMTVRDHASSPNRVSDYLGGLWRKGQVTRSIAPRTSNSSARWAYSWKSEQQTTSISQQIEHHSNAKKFVDSFKDDAAYSKPGIEIRDNGSSVTIELQNFIITISKK
jgi:hypothetical protein